MLLPILACCLASRISPYFQDPANLLEAHIAYGGITVLPGGRFLTPAGTRLYTGQTLFQMLLSPDGRTAVGIDQHGLTVYENVNTGSPGKIEVPIRSVAPAGTFSPDGNRLYVSGGDDGNVDVVDAKTWTILGSISLNVDGASLSYANDIQVSPSGRSLYIADVANEDLVKIDLKTNRVASRVPAGREPYCLALGPNHVYCANIGLFDYSLIPKPTAGEGNPRGLTRPPFPFPSRRSVIGVQMEGRPVPGIGDAHTAGAQSIYEYSIDDGPPKLERSVKSGMLIRAVPKGPGAVGGSAPNALALSHGKLFVSNANNDTVQMFRSGDLKLLRTIHIIPQPLLASYRGVIPTGLALDKSGKNMYVCESGLNAVAVIDVERGVVIGQIPTGIFPVQVRLSPDDRTLYVATQKGMGWGPRGGLNRRLPTDERFGLSHTPGMIEKIAVPDAKRLRRWTSVVLRNDGLIPSRPPRQAGPMPVMPGSPSKQIKYVVFITKENHTFDGVFGGLPGADGQPAYAEWGIDGWIREHGKAQRVPIMKNHWKLAEQFATADNYYLENHYSGDGHRWLVDVYPSLWTTRVYYAGWNFMPTEKARGRLVSFSSNGSQIPEDYLEDGSLWEHLSANGISFRNYGEAFEFPGVDEGPPGSRTGAYEVANFPVPRAVWKNTCWTFPIFNTNIPDIARVDWFEEDLKKNFLEKGKDIPTYMNITLCNDHGDDPRPKEGYPYVCSYMADNDLALGRLVEFLSHLPQWRRMAIFVTEDDPGGDDDHVDRHRSVLLCISPYAKHGYVSHVHTCCMSILRSIYLLLGIGPNNLYDATAMPLYDLFTNKPDFTPYTHVEADPRVFQPSATFDPDDPTFSKRRGEPGVTMDDPKFIRWLRQTRIHDAPASGSIPSARDGGRK